MLKIKADLVVKVEELWKWGWLNDFIRRYKKPNKQAQKYS